MAAPAARFAFTDDVLVEGFVRSGRERSNAVRRRYLLYAVGMLATWGVLHQMTGTLDPLLPIMAVAFVVVAAARPYLVRRNIERLIQGRSDRDRPVSVRVVGDELKVEIDGVARSAMRLAALTSVEPQPEGILVRPQPYEMLWIPTEGFASDADRDAFEHALLAGAPLPDPAL